MTHNRIVHELKESFIMNTNGTNISLPDVKSYNVSNILLRGI